MKVMVHTALIIPSSQVDFPFRPRCSYWPERGTSTHFNIILRSLTEAIQVHFDVPSAYEDIYARGTKFSKDPRFYSMLHQDGSSFGNVNIHEAKIRREIISPLFSRRAVLRLESFVQRKVRHMDLRGKII